MFGFSKQRGAVPIDSKRSILYLLLLGLKPVCRAWRVFSNPKIKLTSAQQPTNTPVRPVKLSHSPVNSSVKSKTHWFNSLLLKRKVQTGLLEDFLLQLKSVTASNKRGAVKLVGKQASALLQQEDVLKEAAVAPTVQIQRPPLGQLSAGQIKLPEDADSCTANRLAATQMQLEVPIILSSGAPSVGMTRWQQSLRKLGNYLSTRRLSPKMVAASAVAAVLIVVYMGGYSQQTYEHALDTIFVELEDQSELQNRIATQKVLLRVEQGSTFGQLMELYPFSVIQTRKLLQSDLAREWLAQKLRIGKVISVEHRNWKIVRIEYPIDRVQTLVGVWDAAQDSFKMEVKKAKIASQPKYVSGEIHNAFYIDAIEQGMPQSLVMSVAGIFQWDIDFINDIRSGDSFKVLYLQEYMEDIALPPTKVLAAEFVVRGEAMVAVAYEFPEQMREKYSRFAGIDVGYYTLSGKPMRKAFLRMPLDFGRVSSRFNPNRIHPLFGTKRPHRGTDYAAPRHTPVMSVAKGVVKTAGTATGYGRYVVVNHGNDISTLYAHLQKINRGIRAGTRVNQGQVIGTVGSSGWATGSHVHFEFKVNNQHKNPETVKLPNVPSLPKELMVEFQQHQVEVMRTFNIFGQRSNIMQGG